MPKKGSSYEEVVSQVVAGLSICKNGRLYRNRRYSGVSQPGEYEIDISLEFNVDGALFFLVIVECKDWSKPVDRPVVQQLIQTRDGIGAHKAAIASPKGFTSEARQVAKAHGIACWEVSEGDVKIIGAMHGAVDRVAQPHPKPAPEKKIDVNPSPRGPDSLPIAWRALRRDFVLVASEALGLPDATPVRRGRSNSVVEDVLGGWHEGELFNAFAQSLLGTEPASTRAEPRLRVWITQNENLLCNCGMHEDEAKNMVAAVCRKEFRSRLWKPARFDNDPELNTSFLQEFERGHEPLLAALRLPVPSSIKLLFLLILNPARLHRILASWQIEESALGSGWRFWRVPGPTATLRRSYTKRMMLLLLAGPPVSALAVVSLCNVVSLPLAPLPTLALRLAIAAFLGIVLSQTWGMSFAVTEVLVVGVLAAVHTSNYLFAVYAIPFVLGFGRSVSFTIQNGIPPPLRIIAVGTIPVAAIAAVLTRNVSITAASAGLFFIGCARLPLYPVDAANRFLSRLAASHRRGR